MLPSRSRSSTSSIPQTRAALSTMASSTGCTSVGERLMMLSTSAVAAWCSSASRSSVLRSCSSWNSRTFSPAVVLSRSKDSASSWRSSAIVCTCSASDVFTAGRRGFAFLLLEPFFVLIAIKQTDRNENVACEKYREDFGENGNDQRVAIDLHDSLSMFNAMPLRRSNSGVVDGEYGSILRPNKLSHSEFLARETLTRKHNKLVLAPRMLSLENSP